MTKSTTTYPATPAAATTATKWPVAWWLIAVALASVVPYLPSLKGTFTLDDIFLILRDPTAHSLAYLPQVFNKAFLNETLGPGVPYYRPLVIASFQANYMIAGPNPLVFRLFNLLLNTIVGLMVFALARRITRSITAAGIAGLAFAVLPSHAESAAWISGRTDLMMTVFALAALLVFARSCESTKPASMAALLGTALLAMCAAFSKEAALMLPPLALGYAWISNCSISRKDKLKWTAAFVVPMVLFILARVHAVHVMLDHPTIMLGQRVMGVGIAYCTYLRMLFVPQGFKVIYDVFPVGVEYPAIAVIAWLAPVGLGVVTLALRRSKPAIAFGAGWILVALFPVSNIVLTYGPLPAERFVYLASVGSAIIIGWFGAAMLRWRPPSIRIWPAAVAAIIAWYCLYCGALTVEGAQYYSSNLAWARAVTAMDSRFLRNVAGIIYVQSGLLKEAEQELEAAIERDAPDLANHIKLAGVYRMRGKPRESLETLLTARRQFGDTLRLELGLGTSYMQVGEPEQAEQTFLRATEIDPKSWHAWRGLAAARRRLGDTKGAAEAEHRATQLRRH